MCQDPEKIHGGLKSNAPTVVLRALDRAGLVPISLLVRTSNEINLGLFSCQA